MFFWQYFSNFLTYVTRVVFMYVAHDYVVLVRNSDKFITII